MVLPLLAWLAVQAVAEPDVDPVVFYWQAVHCAGSSLAELDVLGDAASDDQRLEMILPRGMAMAEYGPRAGRTAEQVDEVDVERPRAFFTAMRAHNRAAFDAQRAYCDALLGG